MAKFKVGDVVQLASGGEQMTIANVIDSTVSGYLAIGYGQMKAINPGAEVFYACTWFNGKDLQNATFREEVLVKA